MREINRKRIFFDTRSLPEKLFGFFYNPYKVIFFMIPYLCVIIYYPALWILWTLLCLVYLIFLLDLKVKAPLRISKDIKSLDSSDYHEDKVHDSFLFGLIKKNTIRRILHKANGIMYLGFTRVDENTKNPEAAGKELWITNSDARTHMFVAGTTGSGKTESLIGMYANTLTWGSGNIYSDGKGDTNLPYVYYSLAKRFGRDDDVLILNYLTGGRDPIVDKLNERTDKEIKLPQSNSFNPFFSGSADFLLQLTSSLLPVASGDAKQWQDKAINMIDALIRILAYKRAKGEIDISIEILRQEMALQNLVKYYISGAKGEISYEFYAPIKTYFEVGLPGFNPDKAQYPEEWDQEVLTQHGYLTGQFSRIISMLCDSYGFIFKDNYPEIDMKDVIVNNRLLVVLIPTMEKSSQEASALGKLFVSSIRLVMADNLGFEIEGRKKDVLDTKATNSPTPFTVILDELGYYFAQGLAVIFAQARSLSFMLIAAAQDVQALKRGEGSEEWASVLANTKIKMTLALEDPEDTFDVFRKAGAEGYFSVSSGHTLSDNSFSNGYEFQDSVNLQRMDRVELQELKNLEPGENFILFKDKVVRGRSFYIDDDDKKTELRVRINRFLQIERPTISIFNERYLNKKVEKEKDPFEKIIDLFNINKEPFNSIISSRNIVLSDLVNAIDKIKDKDYTVKENEILLFTVANFSIKNNLSIYMEHELFSEDEVNPDEHENLLNNLE